MQAQPYYTSLNSQILATIAVNGTPFTSFLGSNRRIILNPLLKPGKNEIRIISHKVENAFKKKDIVAEIAGPAVWSVGKKRFVIKPITNFKSMPGWIKDEQTGRLTSSTAPDADYIERSISFMVKGIEKVPEVNKIPASDPQLENITM